MPDITMCRPVDCPMKDGCYRYTATPSAIQSYGDFSDQVEGGECPNFIDNTPEAA